MTEVTLTDAELWAIAYVNAPDVFLTANLHADDDVTVPDFDTLLHQVRGAYNTGRGGN